MKEGGGLLYGDLLSVGKLYIFYLAVDEAELVVPCKARQDDRSVGPGV